MFELFSINWSLIGIALSAGMVLLIRDWRLSFSALFLNYICLALFLDQQQFIDPELSPTVFGVSTTMIVKFITGAAVTAILTLTALTFSHEYGLEELDEFGLSELRRAARAAQRQRTTQPPRLDDYIVPFWAIVLALLASLILPRLYPIAASQAVDFAWYWLGLTGLFTLQLPMIF